MPEEEPCLPDNLEWPEPHLPYSDTIQELHAAIEKDWDSLRRSACQTAAGRALWKHVIHDPLAELLAGETYLEAAVNSFGGAAQVVLLGAGMDARAYRLSFLNESDVYEVDFADVLQMKNTIIQAAMDSTTECQHLTVAAKSLNRVAGDIKDDNWLEKLQISGFVPQKKTVWILEGILYYLPHSQAMGVLKTIAENCTLTHTILLADFMNKQSTALSSSVFHFYSDWPDQLLPSLGFSDVKLSQIGDPDANYGLLPDPLNLFNKLRSLPRNLQTHPDDGTPCRRLYLVQGSGSPSQVIP